MRVGADTVREIGFQLPARISTSPVESSSDSIVIVSASSEKTRWSSSTSARPPTRGGGMDPLALMGQLVNLPSGARRRNLLLLVMPDGGVRVPCPSPRLAWICGPNMPDMY